MAKRSNSNSRLIILLILTILVAVAILFLPSTPTPESVESNSCCVGCSLPIKIGDTAPDFTVEFNNSDKISLSELRGRVVLINFVTTQCPTAIEEFKYLQNGVINRLAGQEFALLTISCGESAEAVIEFAKSNGYTFPIGIDTNSEIYAKFSDKEFAHTNFIIDQEGGVVDIVEGFSPQDFADLMIKIQNTINKNTTTKHGDKNHSGGCC